MPWLSYGINPHGELVSIWDTPRGKTTLVCPYCMGALTAKRGDRVDEHFAHTDETCRAANRLSDVPTLPCYDNFNLQLSPRELEAVRLLHAKGSDSLSEQMTERLISLEIAQLNTKHWPHQVELTRHGLIPVGGLSLTLFNRVQQQMIRDRHQQLEQKVKDAWKQRPVLLNETLTDLRIYRAQWGRILASTLYFLEIWTPDNVLHKIGVTTRPIEERLIEIRQDLRQHLPTFHVTVQGTWAHRGNVELYFKHRYARYRKQMGSLTEYFVFPNKRLVQADLAKMRPTAFKAEDRAVLAGQPASIEHQIAAS